MKTVKKQQSSKKGAKPSAAKPAKTQSKAKKTAKRPSSRGRKSEPVRDEGKNVSLPKIVGKVIGAIKDKLQPAQDKPVQDKPAQDKPAPAKRSPFGKKGGRKKKQPELSPERQAVLDELKKTEEQYGDGGGSGTGLSSADRPENAFFYSNDKFFNQFEDDEIVEEIRKSYPKFDPERESDSVLKKTVLDMLQDEQFVQKIMDKYSMDVQEFFKFLIRKNQAIFTKQCAQRVQRIIRNKKYNNG